MKLLHTACLIFLIAAILPQRLHAQQVRNVDSIGKKMYWYALGKPSSTLFVHFDKNVYTNRETAWFTGYLLHNPTKSRATVMSVALLRNDDRSILAEKKFVMQGGLSQGSLFIPDSLPTGDYSIFCYTDAFVNGEPTDVFVQPVTIKTVNEDGLTVKLSLVDALKPGMDTLRVKVTATLKNGALVKGAAVTYVIGDRAKPFVKDTLRMSQSGEAIIRVPLKDIDATNNHFMAEVSRGRELQAVDLQLPVFKKAAIVQCYPEGGHLVAGQPCTVGWEVNGSDGAPLEVAASLYQDDKQIATINTSRHGIGRFLITPLANSSYKIKIRNLPYADTAYTLPAAMPQGPVATIKNALAGDTLYVNIENRQTGTKWTALVHNYKSIFMDVTFAANGTKVLVKVPLQDVPKGLCSFTLLDSLQQPYVHRIFFAHFNRKPAIAIEADSAAYHTRQKVVVKLKVADSTGKPHTALVSIACVRNNRLEAKKNTDIESYSYITKELEALPVRSTLMGTDSSSMQDLENLLLVKGWWSYKWDDMMLANAKDTAQQLSSIAYTGKVFIKNKKFKKAVNVSLMRASRSVVFNTDTAGNFIIPQERLVMDPRQYLQLVVANEEQWRYTINVTDFYKEENRKLAPLVRFASYAPALSDPSLPQTAVIDRKERSIQLQDVSIVASKSNNYSANACGDFVCPSNILNCPRHMYGTEPVVGAMYRTGEGKRQIYTGCVGLLYLSRFEGIYTPDSFPRPDYSQEEGIMNGELASTLYWNHTLITNAKGEADFSFYTNDLTGLFKIVIQGITDDATAIYADHFFGVK